MRGNERGVLTPMSRVECRIDGAVRVYRRRSFPDMPILDVGPPFHQAASSYALIRPIFGEYYGDPSTPYFVADGHTLPRRPEASSGRTDWVAEHSAELRLMAAHPPTTPTSQRLESRDAHFGVAPNPLCERDSAAGPASTLRGLAVRTPDADPPGLEAGPQ